MASVNEMLVHMKAIRERINDLKALRQSSSVATSYILRDAEHKTEPQYDVKKVDKKIVELQNFLCKAEAAIKQANAVTKVAGFDNVDMEKLLAPLE